MKVKCKDVQKLIGVIYRKFGNFIWMLTYFHEASWHLGNFCRLLNIFMCELFYIVGDIAVGHTDITVNVIWHEPALIIYL